MRLSHGPKPGPRMHSDLSLGGGHGDVSGAKFLGLGLQGKGELAPISQMWKLRPRGVIRLAQGHKVRPWLIPRATGCPNMEAWRNPGVWKSIWTPSSSDDPRELGCISEMAGIQRFAENNSFLSVHSNVYSWQGPDFQVNIAPIGKGVTPILGSCHPTYSNPKGWEKCGRCPT